MAEKITLATLPQATAQAVFDQAAEHLLTQNAKSRESDGAGHNLCRYRTLDGLACAAGCFVADSELCQIQEGKVWPTLHAQGRVPTQHASLIHRLQMVHDASEVCEWPQKLRELARGQGLQASVVDRFERPA
tara:strand:- start:926 stop:1321 length:396 start_codon:yes stop_codon:yes gene_type:complete